MTDDGDRVTRHLPQTESEMPYDGCECDDPMGLVGMVLPGEPGQLEAMA